MNICDEPVISVITRGVLIGNVLAAEDLDLLVLKKITCVVSVYKNAEWTERLEQKYKNPEIGHIIIPVQDHQSFYDDADRIAGLLLNNAFPRTRIVSESPHSVLIHCGQGISRSPAYVVAFLMWRYGMCLDEALDRVASAHPLANPSPYTLDNFLRCIGKGLSENEFETYKERWRILLSQA